MILSIMILSIAIICDDDLKYLQKEGNQCRWFLSKKILCNHQRHYPIDYTMQQRKTILCKKLWIYCTVPLPTSYFSLLHYWIIINKILDETLHFASTRENGTLWQMLQYDAGIAIYIASISLSLFLFFSFFYFVSAGWRFIMV